MAPAATTRLHMYRVLNSNFNKTNWDSGDWEAAYGSCVTDGLIEAVQKDESFAPLVNTLCTESEKSAFPSGFLGALGAKARSVKVATAAFATATAPGGPAVTYMTPGGWLSGPARVDLGNVATFPATLQGAMAAGVTDVVYILRTKQEQFAYVMANADYRRQTTVNRERLEDEDQELNGESKLMLAKIVTDLPAMAAAGMTPYAKAQLVIFVEQYREGKRKREQEDTMDILSAMQGMPPNVQVACLKHVEAMQPQLFPPDSDFHSASFKKAFFKMAFYK